MPADRGRIKTHTTPHLPSYTTSSSTHSVSCRRPLPPGPLCYVMFYALVGFIKTGNFSPHAGYRWRDTTKPKHCGITRASHRKWDFPSSKARTDVGRPGGPLSMKKKPCHSVGRRWRISASAHLGIPGRLIQRSRPNPSELTHPGPGVFQLGR